MKRKILLNFIKSYLNRGAGNIENILEFIILSENEDIPRFIKIYDRLIQEKKIRLLSDYETSKAHVKRLKTNPKLAKISLEEKENDMKNLQA